MSPNAAHFSLNCISNNDGLLLHSCRRSWTQTSRRRPKSQRRGKAHRKPSPPEYFLFSVPFVFHGDGVCFYKGDISFLLPQKTPLCCQGPSPSGPKPKKMPFVAGKVKEAFQVVCLSSLLALIDRPLSLIVDQPQPFRSRQRSGHTSHDEAPPALALSASERSAQIYRRSQEKPL